MTELGEDISAATKRLAGLPTYPVTRRLREVGELVGVRVLDHVIVGRGRYVSFVDDGYW